MGLDLTASTKSVCLGDGAEALFRLCRTYHLSAPHLMRLRDEFYSDPVVAPAAVGHLRQELVSLLHVHEAVRVPEIKRQRGVFSRDSAVEQAILAPLLESDPVIRSLRRFIEVCEDALAHNTSICGMSD